METDAEILRWQRVSPGPSGAPRWVGTCNSGHIHAGVLGPSGHDLRFEWFCYPPRFPLDIHSRQSGQTLRLDSALGRIADLWALELAALRQRRPE